MLIQEGSTVVQLKQSALFACMENVTRAFYRNDAAINAELVAEIWEAMIYHVLAVRIVGDLRATDPHDAKQTVWSYVMGVEDASGLDPSMSVGERCNRTATWFLNTMQESIETSEIRSAGSEFLASLAMNGVAYAELAQASIQVLTERPEPTVVLVDTLEDYGDNFTRLAEVSKGLLQHLAAHQVEKTGYRLFVCLPSEVSSLLQSLAANPAKSLERSMHIQWTSRELVKLAAQRFALYLSLHDKDRLRSLGISSLDRVPFDESRKLIEAMLPEKVTNGLGTTEPSLMYVIRHTQLLPRQLIQFLNSIWRTNRELGGGTYEVLPQAIIRGVESAEPALVKDVLSAYGAQHPMADDVCRKVIPKLPLKHSVEDARRAIRASKVHKSISGEIDDVLMLLQDVGAFGRHLDTTELYHEAHFSFTFPDLAALERDDTVCIHPAFAKAYQCIEVRKNTIFEDTLPVYAFGSNYGEA